MPTKDHERSQHHKRHGVWVPAFAGTTMVVVRVCLLKATYKIIVFCPGVIAGLDPAIHHFLKKMDARIKSAHDDG
ncbi:MAG: hypothetical protein WBA37_06075 [Xanthobacteraceae bacterium]